MFSYPEPPISGFWGTPTSTIDWCEENYVVTYYIAEAVNTVTNAAFVGLAWFALRNCLRYNIERRFILSCCGFMLVGVGSWLFHMTLKYEYQLLDELPMIYATCVPLWSTFSFRQKKPMQALIGSAILLGALLLTAIYIRSKNPVIHQTAYGALNVLIIIKSVQQSQAFKRKEAALKSLNKTLVIGVSEFLFGWLLWNLDIHFCDLWISLRHSIGMPLGFLIEGHGWWHLFTGLGVYTYLQYLEYLRILQLEIDDQYEYVFKWKIFPITRETNGSARKSR